MVLNIFTVLFFVVEHHLRVLKTYCNIAILQYRNIEYCNIAIPSLQPGGG